jgi:hypothetical protein
MKGQHLSRKTCLDRNSKASKYRVEQARSSPVLFERQAEMLLPQNRLRIQCIKVGD